MKDVIYFNFEFQPNFYFVVVVVFFVFVFFFHRICRQTQHVVVFEFMKCAFKRRNNNANIERNNNANIERNEVIHFFLKSEGICIIKISIQRTHIE